jgi:DMSO reductase anchor subunit
MHPAPSVILFSVLSGLGFGMLAWLGFGEPGVTGTSAFIFFFVAYALAVGGLLSATFHLGNPKNALKSFSQWRTSWLSREGCCAVAALLVMGIYAIGAIFMETHWGIVGIIGAILSVVTVFTTSMIYGQLKTVPRWNHWTTPPLFLSLSIFGGALMTGQIKVAMFGFVLVGLIQIAAWLMGDKQFATRGSTMETATGLGSIGKVRMFEPPHTGTNYLLKEMVYVIGRKHALKLRVIAILLMVVIPVLMIMMGAHHDIKAVIAVLSHLVGVFASRWLFFAEAEHVVGLYYGKRG